MSRRGASSSLGAGSPAAAFWSSLSPLPGASKLQPTPKNTDARGDAHGGAGESGTQRRRRRFGRLFPDDDSGGGALPLPIADAAAAGAAGGGVPRSDMGLLPPHDAEAMEMPGKEKVSAPHTPLQSVHRTRRRTAAESAASLAPPSSLLATPCPFTPSPSTLSHLQSMALATPSRSPLLSSALTSPQSLLSPPRRSSSRLPPSSGSGSGSAGSETEGGGDFGGMEMHVSQASSPAQLYSSHSACHSPDLSRAHLGLPSAASEASASSSFALASPSLSSPAPSGMQRGVRRRGGRFDATPSPSLSRAMARAGGRGAAAESPSVVRATRRAPRQLKLEQVPLQQEMPPMQIQTAMSTSTSPLLLGLQSAEQRGSLGGFSLAPAATKAPPAASAAASASASSNAALPLLGVGGELSLGDLAAAQDAAARLLADSDPLDVSIGSLHANAVLAPAPGTEGEKQEPAQGSHAAGSDKGGASNEPNGKNQLESALSTSPFLPSTLGLNLPPTSVGPLGSALSSVAPGLSLSASHSPARSSFPAPGAGVALGAGVAAPPASTSSLPAHKPCNCKKSKCLKLYCECFARQDFCRGCNCVGCFNTPDPTNVPAREKAIHGTMERDPQAFMPGATPRVQPAAAAAAGDARSSFAASLGLGASPAVAPNSSSFTAPLVPAARKPCTCKKSRCEKNYCICYQAGLSCDSSCKCVDCKNGHDALHHTEERRSKRANKHSQATNAPMGAAGGAIGAAGKAKPGGGGASSSFPPAPMLLPTGVQPLSPLLGLNPLNPLNLGSAELQQLLLMQLPWMAAGMGVANGGDMAASLAAFASMQQQFQAATQQNKPSAPSGTSDANKPPANTSTARAPSPPSSKPTVSSPPAKKPSTAPPKQAELLSTPPPKSAASPPPAATEDDSLSVPVGIPLSAASPSSSSGATPLVASPLTSSAQSRHALSSPAGPAAADMSMLSSPLAHGGSPLSAVATPAPNKRKRGGGDGDGKQQLPRPTPTSVADFAATPESTSALSSGSSSRSPAARVISTRAKATKVRLASALAQMQPARSLAPPSQVAEESGAEASGGVALVSPDREVHGMQRQKRARHAPRILSL